MTTSIEIEAANTAMADIRTTLHAAAHIARKAGFDVRSSKGHDGRVISYYISRKSGLPIRISDHDLPSDVDRLFTGIEYGFSDYSGYPFPQILIDRPRSATWLRRALALACVDRYV